MLVGTLVAIFFVAALFLATESEAQTLDASQPLPDLGSSGGARVGAPEQAGGIGGGRAAARPAAARPAASSAAAPVNAPVGGAPARGTASDTVGFSGESTRPVPVSRGVAGGAIERGTLDRTAGNAVAPAQERVAPLQRQTAPIAQQNTPAGLVNDQATPTPIRQQVRPVQDRVAPIQRGAIEPVMRTVEPVQQTVKPVQQTVKPVVESVFEPVRRTTDTVKKTVEPVLGTAKEKAEPVLKPVKKTTDPVVKTLVDPVVKPALNGVKENIDPIAKPVLDSGKKEAPNTKPVALAGPAPLSENASPNEPMLGGESKVEVASSPSFSATPALSAQAVAEKAVAPSSAPLIRTTQVVPSLGTSHEITFTSRTSVAGAFGGTSLAHNNAAVERATLMTANQHSTVVPSFSTKAAGYLPSLLGSTSTTTTEHSTAARLPQSLPFSSPLPTLPASGNASGGAASGSGGGAPFVGGVLALFPTAFLGGRAVWYAREFLEPDSVFGSIVNQPG